MARHAARLRLPHRITLFYSNRRPQDAAFLDELRALEPPGMTMAMQSMLSALGVKDTDMNSEEFYGY